MIRQAVGAVLLAVAAVAGSTACAPAAGRGPWTTPTPASSAHVADLPVERIAEPVPNRLADGVLPPTNRWYSGLVFGTQPQPVFPYPLAFAAGDDSFTIDLPEVTAVENTIAAPFGGGLIVTIGTDATEHADVEVVRHDPVSVTLEYSDSAGVLGAVTVAEGLPVVSFTADRDVSLALGAPLSEQAPGLWVATADDTAFGVRAPNGHYDGVLHLAPGAVAQVFAVPDDSTPAAWAAALGDPVTDVSVDYAVHDQTADTRLEYGTSTVLVPLPGREPAEGCDLGTFATAYGTAHACRAAELEWSVPRVRATASYDLDGLDRDRRDRLVAQLAADVAAVPAAPADTYFGGKWLARTAGFLSLARSLGETDIADDAADLLWEQLRVWTEPGGCAVRDDRCFAYDDALHLVVGLTPSFGSEEGNDHHFHYGYFLSAGAALAAYRPEVADELSPVLDALAADISSGADDMLPVLRCFDPYRGHSWASGLSPFADGNNQESSSEAVAAWNGLALWARVRGDESLTTQADWMLAAEASAARTLWLEPDLDDEAAGYGHSIVSLTWGGKRDYATWFSSEPSAILGIQLLPIGPVSLQYLAGSPARVDAAVAEAGGADASDAPLGDYVLMFSALGGDGGLAEAESAERALSDDAIDDGNSRSAILAWLAAVELDTTR